MTLDEWVRQLEDQETPVFRQTALEVAEIAADPESGADALSRLIVRDPLLTTKVLKLSNSAFYNPSGRPIPNVGRALLVLGMERIRIICLSVALVETMQKGKRLDRVRRELARSLLAAVLARSIGVETRQAMLDEIFVSALLRRIGPLLFWCIGGEEATTLDGVLRESQDDPATERAVLGFHLAHVSLPLAEGWKLSPLLVEILRGRIGTPHAKAVLHGWEMAGALSEGWGSARAKAALAPLSEHLGVDGLQGTLVVARAVRDARAWALEIGAEELCGFLPEPPPEGGEIEALYMEPEPPPSPPSHQESVRVPRLAEILEELAGIQVLAEIHRLPPLVLDGLHHALGMDRAVFAAYENTSGAMTCRLAQGEGSDKARGSWRFVVRVQMADSFSRSLERNLPIVFDPATSKRPLSLPDDLESILADAAVLFLPFRVQGRVIGAFCGDRAPSRRGLDPACVEGFQMLAEALEATLARLR
jgi:HD-like signal output (HDOD) protein